MRMTRDSYLFQWECFSLAISSLPLNLKWGTGRRSGCNIYIYTHTKIKWNLCCWKITHQPQWTQVSFFKFNIPYTQCVERVILTSVSWLQLWQMTLRNLSLKEITIKTKQQLLKLKVSEWMFSSSYYYLNFISKVKKQPTALQATTTTKNTRKLLVLSSEWCWHSQSSILQQL